MNAPGNIKYNGILADYFAEKPLYLDESGGDKPNARKLIEQPWQQTRGERWSDAIDTLCDFYFIEAKCFAGMTFELIDDYFHVLKYLPENQSEISKEKQKIEKVDRWVRDIIEYGRGWSEQHDKLSKGIATSYTETLFPNTPASCRVWSQEEIDIDCERIINQTDRFYKLKAFMQFLTTQCHTLSQNNKLHGFVLQHALNYDVAGLVRNTALTIMAAYQTPYFLRLWPVEARQNPMPALLYTLKGHKRRVSCVKITPDGRRGVSVSWDNTIRVWDLENGQCLKEILFDQGIAVYSVSITPDGRFAVTGSEGTHLRLWDLDSGQCLQSLAGHNSEIAGVCITPDGRRALSVGRHDKMLCLWDLESGLCLRTFILDIGEVSSLNLSLDGRYAITGSNDGTFCVWDIESGQCLQTIKWMGYCNWNVELIIWGFNLQSILKENTDQNDTEHFEPKVIPLSEWIPRIDPDKRYKSVSVTPDGRIGISAQKGDNELEVWSLNNGLRIKTLGGHSDEVNTVSISADGRRAISGGEDQTVRVWNIENGLCLKNMEWRTRYYIQSVIIMQDGLRAVSTSEFLIIMWDLSDGHCLWKIDLDNKGRITLISANGKRAVSVCERFDAVEKTLVILDLENGTWLKQIKEHTYDDDSVKMTPDGKYLLFASDDNTLQVYNLEVGQYIRTLAGEKFEFRIVSVSRDGQFVISGSSDHTIRVWNIETGICIAAMEGNSSPVIRLSTSLDTKIAASWDKENTVRVWDIENKICQLELSDLSNNVMCLTPDGRCMLSGDGNNTLRLMDLKTGKYLRVFEGHNGQITNLRITADGRHAISGSVDDTFRLWDLESGLCLHTLSGYNNQEWRIKTISCDGRFVILLNINNLLQMWDLENKHCTAFFVSPSPVSSVAISQSGTSVICGTTDGEIIILEVLQNIGH